MTTEIPRWSIDHRATLRDIRSFVEWADSWHMDEDAALHIADLKDERGSYRVFIEVEGNPTEESKRSYTCVCVRLPGEPHNRGCIFSTANSLEPVPTPPEPEQSDAEARKHLEDLLTNAGVAIIKALGVVEEPSTPPAEEHRSHLRMDPASGEMRQSPAVTGVAQHDCPAEEATR